MSVIFIVSGIVILRSELTWLHVSMLAANTPEQAGPLQTAMSINTNRKNELSSVVL